MSLLFKDAPLPGSRSQYPITANQDKTRKNSISNHVIYTLRDTLHATRDLPNKKTSNLEKPIPMSNQPTNQGSLIKNKQTRN
jgi:hypothetical protein